MLQGYTADGTERGVQLAVYWRGRLVVHAWAGTADVRDGRPVRADTLFPIYSTGKGILATIIHRLVERGALAYDQAIASVWPEFAAHGKEHITIAEALNHSAGIPQVPAVENMAEFHNWDAMCRKVAALVPRWPPGTRMEYHAITYAWILGETARRITGKTVPELLRDEICRPLGITEFYLGIPDTVESRVAFLEGAAWQPPAVEDPAIPNWLGSLVDWMNRPDARRACIPASNGIATAEAIARHYAALLPGGVNGVELLPPSRVALAAALQKPALSQDQDYPKCWGLGYQIGGPGSAYGESPRAFGHAGYGGSIGFADPTCDLAVGLTKNWFHAPDGVGRILDEIRREIGGGARRE